MNNYANQDRDHFVNALPPAADAFDDSGGTVYSDIIKVAGGALEFIVITGVGATGTSTFTVEACDDVTPTTNTAIADWYYKEITSDPGDVDWTRATVAGFTRTAGSNAMFRILIPAGIVGAQGVEYARLAAVEVVDSPVLGGILARIIETYHQPQTTTVLT